MRVAADMPARVWKLVVRSGTEVFRGDEIAVLESMKMELPLVVAHNGTITWLVTEGDIVRPGTPSTTSIDSYHMNVSGKLTVPIYRRCLGRGR